MLIDNNADEMFKMVEIDWLMNFWLQEKEKMRYNFREDIVP